MSELEKKDAVCVILGCGPVGSCAIIAACEKFSTVYAIDSVPSRLALAKSYGAIPLNLNEEPIKAVLAATEGRGADAVLEIVGHADALTLAIDLARVGGVVVSSGVHTHNIDMPGRTLYNKNLRFSFGRCPSRVLFPEALELLRKINKTKPELFGDFVEVRAKLSEASKYCEFLFFFVERWHPWGIGAKVGLGLTPLSLMNCYRCSLQRTESWKGHLHGTLNERICSWAC